MVNFNGIIGPLDTLNFNALNRSFYYGDAVFETLRIASKKIFFWESHYLRLMASMRILRMEIPPNFTMEYLENQILLLIERLELDNNPLKCRLTVYREGSGLYTPNTNNCSFLITVDLLQSDYYEFNANDYEIELFKDHEVNSGLLSTVKTANKLIHVLGSIFVQENGCQNGVLLNEKKRIVESLNGNLFLVFGHKIITPPLSDGAMRGIVRKHLLEMANQWDEYSIEEDSISPFDLLKADEVFITNVIFGIQPVTKYRKKSYNVLIANDLLAKLNNHLRSD